MFFLLVHSVHTDNTQAIPQVRGCHCNVTDTQRQIVEDKRSDVFVRDFETNSFCFFRLLMIASVTHNRGRTSRTQIHVTMADQERLLCVFSKVSP